MSTSDTKPQNRAVEIVIAGQQRQFDIDDPDLPKWVKDNDLSAGNYPYKDKIKRRDYDDILYDLHIELVKLQAWQHQTGARIISLFEGRDAAGKGGCIGAIRENINPRSARIVALPKPSDREQSEWYFQRYATHLPAAGELVLFDRSWYNRAGVEPVMGFCTPDQHEAFLNEAPAFESSLARDGIFIFKYWLAIGRETQLKRFHDRCHDPRKTWKLSPMDIKALDKWDDYARARDTMLSETNSNAAPWTVVLMSDKRRGRINLIKNMLTRIPYDHKNDELLQDWDTKIVIDGADYQ